MSNLKSPRIKKRTFIIYAALALLVPLVILAQGNKGKANKDKSDSCQTITADAVFRDATQNGIDGIRSDGDFSSIYGDSKYYGNEDTLVCLLKEQDHDFILSTEGGTKYERESGVDRKVTLDFSAHPDNDLSLLPFDPVQVVDVLIRVDEVLSDTDYTDPEKRFLLWFKVGRDSYQLRFDGADCELVAVTQTGINPNRIWTINSTGSSTAWFVKLKGLKKNTVGYFKMPFKITVYETTKPPTCL